jgi:hypothetical protein
VGAPITPPNRASFAGGGPAQCAGFISGRYKQVKLPVFYRLSFLAGHLRRR